MRFVVFNADDFGYGRGINRGILEAHEHGVVTSATLVVNGPAALEAVAIAKDHPRLSVGLHVNLTNEAESWFDIENEGLVREELERQLGRFVELLGRPPAHIDSHQHVHRARGRRPLFRALAKRLGVPLRDELPVVFKGGFYGQWEYQVFDPDKVSAGALCRMLRNEIHAGGIYEVSCHPGYLEAGRDLVYHQEREHELRTLCDPRVRELIADQGIGLLGYDALPGALERLSRERAAA
ncbi:MAG: ChbG/HpnK family deacetylase [Vicinamibacteria bacterium]